ncbi:HAMP domain-containing sensor histidine kinase [Levilactobacillus brevis]|uniref:histidine kinase n=1 Tax=Levilactobacillus brevis TaxID=1580 RepID=A0AB38X250_LEVBR|nr:HAMP domain-containing sensor histidine kinase [Levilactobacillus brevis]WAD00709.1 HAMP domain-containing sensor histidine kinase [Levilactobacillus brevis]
MSTKTPPRTYADIIRHSITSLLLMIGVIIVITVSITLTIDQLVRAQDQAAKLSASLQTTQVSNFKDWLTINRSSGLNSHNTFVLIKNANGTTTSLLPHAQQLAKANTWSVPFTHLVYIKGWGLFFSETLRTGSRTYALFIGMHVLIGNLHVLISVLIIAIGLSLLIGLLYVRRLAKRLSAPTLTLAQAAKQAAANSEATQPELPQPSEPVEIGQLASDFNQLLAAQNGRLQRERQFISDASHELRTPIATIRGNLKLIERRGKQHSEIIPESLGFIDQESLRMQHLIENLLHLSRADRAEISLHPVDIDPLVQSVIAHYQPLIDQPITYDGPATPTMVLADTDMLHQVLTALLDNAHKYGAPDQSIDVTVAKQAQHVTLSVADHGPGISTAERPHIFERFYRVDESRSNKIEGSGLGLAIVAQLVRLNKGTITITDNPPHGACFIISLPSANEN